MAICFPLPPPPLWNGTSFLLLLPRFSLYTIIIGITIYGSPLPPVERDILPSPAALPRCGTGHPSFSCCPGSVYIQLYRHNDMFSPPPLWNGTYCFPALPPCGTGHPSFSCCPFVQFIYNYIGITIYVSPLPPCGTGHPSFSCCPGLWFFCIHSQG